MFVMGSYDGFQADVWSIGCILLELLVGHDTFGECWMTAYDSEYMKDKTDFRNEISDAVNELKGERFIPLSTIYIITFVLLTRSPLRPAQNSRCRKN